MERAYKLKSIQTHVPLKMVSKYDYQIIRNVLRLFFCHDINGYHSDSTASPHFCLCFLDDPLFHRYKIAVSMLQFIFLGASLSEGMRLIKVVLIDKLSTCSDLAVDKV